MMYTNPPHFSDFDDGPIISGRALVEAVIIAALVLALFASVWFAFFPTVPNG